MKMGSQRFTKRLCCSLFRVAAGVAHEGAGCGLRLCWFMWRRKLAMGCVRKLVREFKAVTNSASSKVRVKSLEEMSAVLTLLLS